MFDYYLGLIIDWLLALRFLWVQSHTKPTSRGEFDWSEELFFRRRVPPPPPNGRSISSARDGAKLVNGNEPRNRWYGRVHNQDSTFGLAHPADRVHWLVRNRARGHQSLVLMNSQYAAGIVYLLIIIWHRNLIFMPSIEIKNLIHTTAIIHLYQ